MNENKPTLAPPVPGAMYVDATPYGQVVFTSVDQDDNMRTTVLYMTPATAAKLGQWLINVAASLEMP